MCSLKKHIYFISEGQLLLRINVTSLKNIYNFVLFPFFPWEFQQIQSVNTHEIQVNNARYKTQHGFFGSFAPSPFSSKIVQEIYIPRFRINHSIRTTRAGNNVVLVSCFSIPVPCVGFFSVSNSSLYGFSEETQKRMFTMYSRKEKRWTIIHARVTPRINWWSGCFDAYFP